MEFDLFYTPGSEDFKDTISRRIQEVFPGTNVKDRGILKLYEGAYNIRRRQYDAYVLLDYAIRCMRSEYALWVVDRDIYCENVNFVFGLAMYNIAAVVSTYRLDSAAMVAKEAIHEVGHVLGLKHCKNTCVMQFSNTIEEALKKPDTICSRCRGILDRKIVEPGTLT